MAPPTPYKDLLDIIQRTTHVKRKQLYQLCPGLCALAKQEEWNNIYRSVRLHFLTVNAPTTKQEGNNAMETVLYQIMKLAKTFDERVVTELVNMEITQKDFATSDGNIKEALEKNFLFVVHAKDVSDEFRLFMGGDTFLRFSAITNIELVIENVGLTLYTVLGEQDDVGYLLFISEAGAQKTADDEWISNLTYHYIGFDYNPSVLFRGGLKTMRNRMNMNV
jgi:hypothetical protein